MGIFRLGEKRIVPAAYPWGYGEAKGRFWTPAIRSTVLWLDAADEVSLALDGSGNVSRWDDKSGNDYCAVQNTPANRPSITTLNGLTVINTATSKWLSHTLAAAMLRNRSAAIIAILYKTDTPNTSTWRFAFANRGDAGGTPAVRVQIMVANNNAYQLGSRRLDSDNSGVSVMSSVSADINYHIHVANLAWTSGFAEYFIDGTSQGTGNYATSGNTSDTDLQTSTDPWQAIGNNRSNTGDLYLNGAIAEIVVATKSSGTYTETLPKQLEGYLAHKWGLTANLPSDHPYKSKPPVY